MRQENDSGLGKKKDRKRDAVEHSLGDAVQKSGHGEAAEQFREPIKKGNCRRSGGGVVANGEAGEPAAERVLIADVEKHGDGKEKERQERERSRLQACGLVRTF